MVDTGENLILDDKSLFYASIMQELEGRTAKEIRSLMFWYRNGNANGKQEAWYGRTSPHLDFQHFEQKTWMIQIQSRKLAIDGFL
jgi:hypothetical protein